MLMLWLHTFRSGTYSPSATALLQSDLICMPVPVCDPRHPRRIFFRVPGRSKGLVSGASAAFSERESLAQFLFLRLHAGSSSGSQGFQRSADDLALGPLASHRSLSALVFRFLRLLVRLPTPLLCTRPGSGLLTSTWPSTRSGACKFKARVQTACSGASSQVVRKKN